MTHTEHISVCVLRNYILGFQQCIHKCTAALTLNEINKNIHPQPLLIQTFSSFSVSPFNKLKAVFYEITQYIFAQH